MNSSTMRAKNDEKIEYCQRVGSLLLERVPRSALKLQNAARTQVYLQ